ncbi:MAG: hypothetical protein P8Y71_26520, partial [Pseudolabrys sp.]
KTPPPASIMARGFPFTKTRYPEEARPFVPLATGVPDPRIITDSPFGDTRSIANLSWDGPLEAAKLEAAMMDKDAARKNFRVLLIDCCILDSFNKRYISILNI